MTKLKEICYMRLVHASLICHDFNSKNKYDSVTILTNVKTFANVLHIFICEWCEHFSHKTFANVLRNICECFANVSPPGKKGETKNICKCFAKHSRNICKCFACQNTRSLKIAAKHLRMLCK